MNVSLTMKHYASNCSWQAVGKSEGDELDDFR